jgi:pimeloyl-ACP methyl ester carboxylesterase
MSLATTWDKNGVKYRQVIHNTGDECWLFIPGGPGADSWYMHDLAESLNMPGESWLVDFPGNGANKDADGNAFRQQQEHFLEWPKYLVEAIPLFKRVFLVCHSFGGILAMTLPKLEHKLAGLIVLNSAPSISMTCSLKKFVSLMVTMVKTNTHFMLSYRDVLIGICQFYLNMRRKIEKLKQGRPYNLFAAIWWIRQLYYCHYQASWVPISVPTLIILAADDFITPAALFKHDHRFYRSNIQMVEIPQAGHFVWHEKNAEVKEIIHSFHSCIHSQTVP